MAKYNVKSTRKSKAPITINENEVDNSIAVKLFGRKKLAYGKDLNENLLRLLESFSCPRSPSSVTPIPDVSKASDNMFDNPVEGQLWYDSTPTKETLFVFDGTKWSEQRKFGDIAANWGVIADGGQIPLPVSPNGRTYTYAECSWIVSPYGYPNTIDYMNCRTQSNATVTMQYSLENDPALIGGFANYLIIGIPGNVNLGVMTPGASVTPTPTVTATPTPTRAATPTPTTSISKTPTPTPTKAVTPTPTPSASSVPASPPPSPGTSVTPTPTITITPTPSTSPLPDFSITVSQGDGSQYGSGLYMTASNGSGCYGFCGTGEGFAPGTSSDLQHVGIVINGGVAPFTLVVDSWAVDPGSPNTMFGEFLTPYGNFSGANVEGNPLNNPTWTWTGGSTAGRIRLSGAGKCAYNEREITGSAVIRCTDSAGRTVTSPFGWTMIRSSVGGDMDCGGGAGCVTCDTEILGSGVASTVKVGDTMTVINPETLELGTGLVSKADIKLQPCVRITSESGVVLECSTTAPIALASGGQALAPTLAGLEVLVYDNGLVTTETVVSVEDIGEKEIVHITCENNFFLAAETAGRYFLHHNLKDENPGTEPF